MNCIEGVSNVHDHIKAESFRTLLSNPRTLAFAQKIITQSYVECVPGYEDAMRDLLQRAFAILTASRDDERAFQAAVASLITKVFKKQDPDFWFNRLYQGYKRHFKPQDRFLKLQPLLSGERVLDFGSGNGLTSAILAQHGYRVSMTDVLDYRDEGAKALPFVQMDDSTTLPYPAGSFDTAIVFAVLHHIEPENVRPLLTDLRRVSRRLIVEEDCYGVPDDLQGLAEALRDDAQLREFVALSLQDQLRFLMFLDYFANAITQGLPEMDIPFEFRTVREWQALFADLGFEVHETLVKGFQKQYFNRSCHVWFVLDAA